MFRHAFFDAVGFFFVLLFGIEFLFRYLSHQLVHLLWFSNHVTLIIGLALLFRSRFWLTAEVALGLVPELFWITDFIWYKATGNFLTGVTSYLLELSPAHYALTLQHLVVIPLAGVCLFVLGAQRNAFLGVFLHGSFLWLCGFMLGELLNNNCMLRACVPFLQHQAYALFWPFLMLAVSWLVFRLLLVIAEHDS